MEDNSVDSIVTDPPYGLSFMGKKWDYDVPGVDIWAECLRVLKPGGHLLAFAGTRTQHRMAVRIEDAGFEIRDMIAWVYGCLDQETEVATKNGVMPYHRTKVGDLVLCYDKVHGKYSYQPILEIVEYDYSDTAYRLVGDFGEQVVSRNHRVIVERGGVETFAFAETLELEAHVPFLESLPALHQALHGAEPDTSDTEQDMPHPLRQRAHRCGGQPAGESDAFCNERPAQGVRAWGGHKTALVRVVPFHYTGKVWCLRVPTGAFVAVRNGVAFPTGNSGFPKSLDVSKAIDKAAGVDLEKGKAFNVVGGTTASNGGSKFRSDHPDYIKPQGITEAAQQWDGWGTALKPALEPITVARKPLVGTVAANVLAHGTGALNIDACRVEGAPRALIVLDAKATKNNTCAGRMDGGSLAGGSKAAGETALGRWPANLILSIPEDEYSLRDDVTPEQLRQLAEWMDANP